jgi:nicotinamide mononucleotide adenylyltransferase
MTEAKIAFGIAHGRFQPPHIEHVEYLLSSKRHCNNLIIGVTNPTPQTIKESHLSPHRHSEDANPFTFLERQIMLRDCLLDRGLSAKEFSIVPFDLFSSEQWSSFIPDAAHAEFLVRVFSDWELSKMSLFADHGYKVQHIDAGISKSMTATDVRERYRSGGNWEALVPLATAEFIRNREGDQNRAI